MKIQDQIRETIPDIRHALLIGAVLLLGAVLIFFFVGGMTQLLGAKATGIILVGVPASILLLALSLR